MTRDGAADLTIGTAPRSGCLYPVALAVLLRGDVEEDPGDAGDEVTPVLPPWNRQVGDDQADLSHDAVAGGQRLSIWLSPPTLWS
jgi:hypothetical protein